MPIKTKKHLDRVKRETRQRQFLLIGTIVVVVFVLAVIGYGFLQEKVMPPYQPVAKVGADSISTQTFQARVRFERRQLIARYMSNYELMQSLSQSNPDFVKTFQNNLDQIKASLDPLTLGNQVLEQMIQGLLIRQEAKRRGIIVTDEEVEKSIQEQFGYIPEGTAPTATSTNFPTPPPTSTLTTEQLALKPFSSLPTATPGITETSAPTATLEQTSTPTEINSATPAAGPTLAPTITPIPTVYTKDKYLADYKTAIDAIVKDAQFPEANLRDLIRTQLYSQKLMAVMSAELPVQQEQVWARHILVADEATAKEVFALLQAKGDWNDLAIKYSTDPSTKNIGGDLGWFARGFMVKEFEDVVFKLATGEISQPVKTQFGWHIIQVLGHETRPIGQAEYEQLQQKTFQDWLDQQRKNPDVKTYDYWKTRVPTEPALPESLQ